MGAITSAGVGSGLPLDTIIQSILQAESQPKILALDRKEAGLQTTLSGVGSLKAALSKFNDAVAKLKTLSDFQKVKATSSDTSRATATAATNAVAGTYSVTVDALANGSRAETINTFANSSAVVASGLAATKTLTFTVGASNFTVDVTNTTTYAQLRDEINTKGKTLGVTAVIVNTGVASELSISSSTTGAGNTLAISNNDALLDVVSTVPTGATAGLAVEQSAASASVTIDTITVTSTSNTFTNLVDGVTLTAVKKTDAGTPITLTVANDTASVSTSVKSLVDSFNDLVKTIKQLGSTAGSAKGALVGDALLRQTESRLRAVLGGTVSNGGKFKALPELGVTTQKDGTLLLDTTKLNTAMSSNFLDVGTFFAGTGGLAISLSDTLKTYIGTGGSVPSRETSLQKQIKSIGKEREALNYRIGQLETRLRKQFAALDSLVARLNNTGSFLAQQLNKQTASSSKS